LLKFYLALIQLKYKAIIRQSHSRKASAFLCKDRVDIGTHTHVATDHLMIDNGTVYLSDMGLSGCRDSMLGMQSDIAILRFVTG